MSFSSEEHIEEILWNAHEMGVAKKLMTEVDKIVEKDPKQSRLDVYIHVYNKLKQERNLSKK